MGTEVEQRQGTDTTLRSAIPCRASDGNELRTLSAETSVSQKKRKKRKKSVDEAHKTPTRKTVEHIWEVRIPLGGRSRWCSEVRGRAVILSSSGGEITIYGCWENDGDWDGRAQRGPGAVIRSLPRRTGRCLESNRVAGWPLTACSSSGTRELWGIGEKLVVNFKCDILLFAYRERRK